MQTRTKEQFPHFIVQLEFVNLDSFIHCLIFLLSPVTVTSLLKLFVDIAVKSVD